MYDIVVVGAGIVGLATARELLLRSPSLRLLVVEKESEVAAHQTGHNSGVLHSGLYYPPGSLKARLCRSGKALIEQFAEEHEIAVDRCGKVIIATESGELSALDELRRRGNANGVPELQMVGPAGLRDIEPNAIGLRALWSPSTAIVDFRAVANAMTDDIRSVGGQIRLNFEITTITRESSGVVLGTGLETVTCRNVVVCAGLQADRLSLMTGSRTQETMVPFRGSYYLLSPSARNLVRGLIYPVPDPRFPFLGYSSHPPYRWRSTGGPQCCVGIPTRGLSSQRRANQGPPIGARRSWISQVGSTALADGAG